MKHGSDKIVCSQVHVNNKCFCVVENNSFLQFFIQQSNPSATTCFLNLWVFCLFLFYTKEQQTKSTILHFNN